MFAPNKYTFSEEIAIMLSLAVCSDGKRKKVEEDMLINSELFSKEVKSDYFKVINVVELLQDDSDSISLGMFSKMIQYSNRLMNYENKQELYDLIVKIIFADKIETHSEEQFLEVLKDVWKL